MEYTFGKRSSKELATCHKDLQLILKEALSISEVDFSIIQAHRSPVLQFEYFQKGREKRGDKWVVVDKGAVITNIDGYKIKGKHNYQPSRAVDIAIYVPKSIRPTKYKNYNFSYDKEHLCYVAGIIMATAKMLYRQNRVTREVRSGLNWDRDGIILKDQNLADMPHIEIIT